jgi:glutamate-1-semialdehyde 2,1-aminomutase
MLRRLRDPAVYDELEDKAARLENGLAPLGRVQRVGAMLTLFFPTPESGSDPIKNFAQASSCDTARYAEYFQHMLERGVYVPPSQYEAMFVSLAHRDEEIDRTVEAAAELAGA